MIKTNGGDLYTVAITVPFAGRADELVDALQSVYDDGNVAGFFNITPASAGSFEVLFERYWSEDAEVIEEKFGALSREHAAVCQLRAEIAEASDDTPLAKAVIGGLTEIAERFANGHINTPTPA